MWETHKETERDGWGWYTECMAIRIGWSNIAVDDFNLVSIKLSIMRGNGKKCEQNSAIEIGKKESISIDYHKCVHALQFEWFCQRQIISSPFDLSASLRGKSCCTRHKCACNVQEMRCVHCACMQMWSKRTTIHQHNDYVNGQANKHLSNLDFYFF